MRPRRTLEKTECAFHVGTDLNADTIREEHKYFLANRIITLQDASKNSAAPYVCLAQLSFPPQHYALGGASLRC